MPTTTQAAPSRATNTTPPSPSLSQRAAVRQVLRGAQAKLTISQEADPCEREAEQVAERITGHACPSLAAPPALQRRASRKDEALPAQEQEAAPETLAQLGGGGTPLSHESRGFYEPRFGADFSGVRVHHDQRAAHLARSLQARAFTQGKDIYFNQGEYQPDSSAGKHLLAHELTHVVQQGASSTLPRAQARRGGARGTPQDPEDRRKLGGAAQIHAQAEDSLIMRDLAIEPPNPEAVGELSEEQITTAIRYNTARFQDPYTVMIVRDVVGIPKYPAVSDRDLAVAVAQYQAQFNLTVDGRIGPATTRRLVRELRAEDQRRFATLLRQDNMVTWSTVTGPAYRNGGEFQWDVSFNTTLREGWLIQRIDNTWNASNGAGVDVTPAFTARYWEAWWVDNSGDVLLPTSTANPPATMAIPGADDFWFNPAVANSTGTWSQAGTMYTALTLPAGFVIQGVPEAGDLPATTGPVNSDDLGLAEGSRRVSGRWDDNNADPAQRFHRAT